jgi:hypothetical protein
VLAVLLPPLRHPWPHRPHRRAYYTIAHLLQNGVLDGSVPGSAGIKPEQLNDGVRRLPGSTQSAPWFLGVSTFAVYCACLVAMQVWNYVFLDGPVPPSTDIPVSTLEVMRRVGTRAVPYHAGVGVQPVCSSCTEWYLCNRHACVRARCRSSISGTPWTFVCLARFVP